MKITLQALRLVLLRLSIALLSYPVCKIFFFLVNHRYFPGVSLPDFTAILFFGLRFDIPSVAVMNAPFIVFHMVPFGFTRRKWYRLWLKVIFLVPNSIAILANCMDFEYYRFTLKHTTADFFSLFRFGSDIAALLPQYVKDFWFIGLFWVGITVLIGWLYGKTEVGRGYKGYVGNRGNAPGNEDTSISPIPSIPSDYLSWFGIHFLLIGLLIVGFRGGLQLRPIMPINASEYVEAKNIPLILNTPFTIIKTIDLETIEEKKYFPDNELNLAFNPIHKSAANGTRNNVFIIILESFSKEFTSLGHRKSYTPFLDSLMNESLVFDNAFANGKRSIEGIPAVLAGIPALMNESFITSTYCSDQFTSLATALKPKGYSSAFFHGGTNGTMGFDAFCSSAGFDKYYGRFEYNNDSDYDGEWGIWDEKFFRYTEKQVSAMKTPFLAALFSLSSHHPYRVPEPYVKHFAGGSLPILKSVQYADYSLKKLFESASKEKWFDSTLFVITADHAGPSEDNFYSNSVGNFEVPIIFYKPNSSLKKKSSVTAQQADILPTVLGYLGYDRPFFAFGNDLLDSTLAPGNRYAVNFINDVYQIFQQDYLLQFDGNKTIGLYRYKADSLLQHNLLEEKTKDEVRGAKDEGLGAKDEVRDAKDEVRGAKDEVRDKEVKEAMEKKLKAIIQTYQHAMIHNELTAR